MESPSNRRVVLGVTGGIAAYKSPDVARRLRERGCDVRVVMTESACAFITPLTLQAVSGRPVHQDLLDESAEAAMGHIELARWAELVLVAPATANFIARLAHGHADDLLTTMCLATEAPIVVAPAMNQQMWQAAPTRANLERLAGHGVEVIGPGTGNQACGEEGPGRMLEPLDVVEQVLAVLGDGPLAGLTILVTAGPTRESLDPVRFVSNHSSGKMGYAAAAAAARLGGDVVLISGPTDLSPPPGVRRVGVTSAAEMHEEVLSRVAGADVFVAAAAVADYAPVTCSGTKLKKRSERLTVELQRTPDILREVAALSGGPFTVGFAAETDGLEDNARAKLESKSLDMIAANLVGGADLGFNSDDNALRLFWTGGGMDLARAPKTRLALDLMRVVAERYHAKHTAQDP